MIHFIQAWTWESVGSGAALKIFLLDVLGLEQLGAKHVPLRDVGVPLDHRVDRAYAPDGLRVKVPDLRTNRLRVGVDQVELALLGTIARMPGQVDLPYAVEREPVQKAQRIEAVVHRADKNVVHVEQEPAVGLARDLRKEFPLAHLGM